MTLLQFTRLANRYRNMGDSVIEQLRDCINGGQSALADQNPNALKMIRDDFLIFAVAFKDKELANEAQCQIDEINEYLVSTEGGCLPIDPQ